MPPSVITQNTTVSFNGTLITALHNMTNITKTNTTLAKSEGTNAHDIVVIVIHIFLFLLAALGNITLIVVRLKTFMQHGLSAYKQLICHLSVADIIFATAVPLDIYSRINKKDLIQNTIVCKFLKTTQSASLTASISIMTVMALERYQGISNPLSHRWTTKKVFLLFVAIWGYSYINFIPYTIALGVQYGICYDIREKYPNPEFGKWYTLYQFLSTWLLPVVLISVFHLGMVWKLVTHRKTIRGSIYCRSATADCRSQDGSSRPKRKMIKILVVIVTLFALLTLPIHVWYLWHEFADRSSSQEKGLNMTEIFASMVYTHSAVNPVIYSIMDQSFREDVKNMLGLKHQKKKSLLLRGVNGTTKGALDCKENIVVKQ